MEAGRQSLGYEASERGGQRGGRVWWLASAAVAFRPTPRHCLRQAPVVCRISQRVCANAGDHGTAAPPSRCVTVAQRTYIGGAVVGRGLP